MCSVICGHTLSGFVMNVVELVKFSMRVVSSMGVVSSRG